MSMLVSMLTQAHWVIAGRLSSPAKNKHDCQLIAEPKHST